MIQAYFDEILQSLFVSHAVSFFRILKRENVNVETYSYHWQKANGSLIKRWDNVVHHKEIETFPHHLHLADNKVIKSPYMTLKKVLAEIGKTLTIDHD